MGIATEGERVVDARNYNAYVTQFNDHLKQCELLLEAMKALAAKYPTDAKEIGDAVASNQKALEEIATKYKV
jgi:hypothetical protein